MSKPEVDCAITIMVRAQRGEEFSEESLFLPREAARNATFSAVGTAIQREIYEALRRAVAGLDKL